MSLPFAAGAAWIDGEFVPARDARIRILDTGFVRSDLTYDVVGVWDGAFFRLDDHLERFKRNWLRLRLTPPLDRPEMRDVLIQLVARSGLREAYVAMIVTRGVPGPGERDPRHFENRFYAYAIPYVWIVSPELQQIGTHVVVARDTRRVPPGSFDPTVKNFQWGDLMRGLYEAYDRNAFTAILTDGEGNVTEGPGFNVFALIDGVLRTPDRGVFDGMTRRTIIELAAIEGIPAQAENMPVSTLYEAAELFMTSTAGGVMPVTTLDGAPVGDGRPGPITMRLREAYWAAHANPRYTTSVTYSADGAEDAGGLS